MFCGVMGHRFVLSLIGPVWAVDQSYCEKGKSPGKTHQIPLRCRGDFAQWIQIARLSENGNANAACNCGPDFCSSYVLLDEKAGRQLCFPKARAQALMAHHVPHSPAFVHWPARSRPRPFHARRSARQLTPERRILILIVARVRFATVSRRPSFPALQGAGMLANPSTACGYGSGHGSGLPAKPSRGRIMTKVAAVCEMPAEAVSTLSSATELRQGKRCILIGYCGN
jgi:hypothetical protein